MNSSRYGADISILFVSYNRSDLLDLTFHSLRRNLDFGGLKIEFIVTDDASEGPHRSRILALPFDKHLISDVNRGLGNNLNKGIAATSGAYVLQIQDDCEFIGEKVLVLKALRILEADLEVGMIQLTNQTPDVPHEIRYLPDATAYRVFENDKIPRRRASGTRPYTDQPHLKRIEFCRSIGPYKEGVPMSRMELDYQQRVACQNRWRVAALDLPSAFRHLGAERSWNDSHALAKRHARLYSLPLIGPVLRAMRPAARWIRDRAGR